MGEKKDSIEYVVRRVAAVGAKRVILVYNPRSSKAKRVEEEVLNPARAALAEKLGVYEVLPTNVDDNAAKLAEVLLDGDVVLTAGGDGTAAIGLNGAMLSGKDVYIAALPYGNFNDMARLVRKAEAGSILCPIEATVDGKHFRYAACYFTMGMLAESTEIFDGDKMRKDLQTGGKSVFYSLIQLMKWYFANRKREFLPKFSVQRNWQMVKKPVKTSDYMVVNGVSVAKIMRGGKWYAGTEKFLAIEAELTNVFKLGVFMLRSLAVRVPGKESKLEIVKFAEPATVEIQAEGEYKKLEGVKEIIFKKAGKSIRIL